MISVRIGQQHFLLVSSRFCFDDFCSRSRAELLRIDFFAVSSSSSGRQVFKIKSKTFSTLWPVFALVSKNGLTLKPFLGLPFFSFCSNANFSPTNDITCLVLFVTRSAFVPTTTTRHLGSAASRSCKCRSWRA